MMGIQIRLRHALGQRMFTVPDRPMVQPAIVGRGAGAELQIPSVGVEPKHLALFVHQGYWYVRDLSAGQMLLDGQQIAQAMPLQIGSVIHIGQNVATIEIEPAAAAAGRQGYVAAATQTAASLAATPVHHPPSTRPATTLPRQVASVAQPAYAEDEFPQEIDADGEIDTVLEVAADAGAYVPPTRSYSTRQSGKGGLIAAVVAGIVVVAGIGIYFATRGEPAVVVAPAKPVKPAKPAVEETEKVPRESELPATVPIARPAATPVVAPPPATQVAAIPKEDDPSTAKSPSPATPLGYFGTPGPTPPRGSDVPSDSGEKAPSTGAIGPKPAIPRFQEPVAQKIVFVCDANGTLALHRRDLFPEIQKAVNGMRGKQEFQVFIATAQKPLFVADGNWLPATAENKKAVEQFINKLPLPKPETPLMLPAVEAAMALNPELIYINLGIGSTECPAILKRVSELNAKKRIKINTILMGTNEEIGTSPRFAAIEKALQQIASENGGSYRWVRPADLK